MLDKMRPLFVGVLAVVGLFAFYAVILGVSNGVRHVWTQFVQFWPFIVVIGLGFGVQMGMYQLLRVRAAASSASLGASGGISGGTMVACCAHHLSEIASVVGLSGAFLFLSEYQVVFLWIGAVSSVFGSAYFLYRAHQASLLPRVSVSGKHKTVLAIAGPLLLTVIVLAGAGAFSFFTDGGASVSDQATGGPVASATPVLVQELQFQEDSQGQVRVGITPMIYPDRVVLDMAFNTHSVDLSFEVSDVSSLSIDGKVIEGGTWDGAQAGGHHRSGTLTYGVQAGSFSKMEIVVRGVDVPERRFTWTAEN